MDVIWVGVVDFDTSGAVPVVWVAEQVAGCSAIDRCGEYCHDISVVRDIVTGLESDMADAGVPWGWVHKVE